MGGRPVDPSNPLKSAYKEAKRVLRREFRKLRRNNMDDFYNSMDVSDPNIFSKVRQKLGRSTIPTSSL